MSTQTREMSDAHRKSERDSLPAPAKKIYDKAYAKLGSHKAAMQAVAMKFKKNGSTWVAKRSADVVVEIEKIDAPKRQAFGWAYVSVDKHGNTVFDSHGDSMPIEELEKAAYDYMLDSRIGGEMHARVSKSTDLDFGPVHASDVIESIVFTPEKIEKMGLPSNFPQGWWIGQQFPEGETWEKIEKGEYTMFSIHGMGLRKRLGDDGGEPEETIRKARATIAKAESLEDLDDLALAYLSLQSAAAKTEAISKGPNRHGKSIKCPDIYEALRREGASKEKAAKISNECYSSPNCNCH